MFINKCEPLLPSVRESALREPANFTITLQRPWTSQACIHKLRLPPNRAKAAKSHHRPQTTLNAVQARDALTQFPSSFVTAKLT